MIVEAVGANGRWAAVCQARKDTDGDGKIAVRYGPRGELAGDAMRSYFVLGGGKGEPIDAVAAHDRAGRYVVLETKKRLVFLDHRALFT